MKRNEFEKLNFIYLVCNVVHLFLLKIIDNRPLGQEHKEIFYSRRNNPIFLYAFAV